MSMTWRVTYACPWRQEWGDKISRYTQFSAGAYTPSLLSSTLAVLVTPPRVPLSNKLGENHAPNVSHKMCLR